MAIAWRAAELTGMTPREALEMPAPALGGVLGDVLTWGVALTGLGALMMVLWSATSRGRRARALADRVADSVADTVPNTASDATPPHTGRAPNADPRPQAAPAFPADGDSSGWIHLPLTPFEPPLGEAATASDCSSMDAASRLLHQSAQRLEREAAELQANCADLAVLSGGARRSTTAAATLAVAAQRHALEIGAALDACATRHAAAAASLAGCIEIAAAHARALDPKPGAPRRGPPGGIEIIPAPHADLGDDAEGPCARDIATDARLIAELTASTGRAFDEVEAGWRMQRAAMQELAARLASLAGETAAIHRMVCAQADCSQYTAHASHAVSAHALRLGDDARRLTEAR